MITIIAKFDVLPSCLDDFVKASSSVTRDTRKERGNLSYKIFRLRDDETKFTFIEEWLNDTAIEQHNNTEHFKKFIDEITPMLKSEPRIEQFLKAPSVYC